MCPVGDASRYQTSKYSGDTDTPQDDQGQHQIRNYGHDFYIALLLAAVRAAGLRLLSLSRSLPSMALRLNRETRIIRVAADGLRPLMLRHRQGERRCGR